MYLVLSAFTSSPISLVAPTKVSAFSLTVCAFPPNILATQEIPRTLWNPRMFNTAFTSAFLHMIHNIIRFYGEELLALGPTPKLEDHPLSTVRECLFDVFSNFSAAFEFRPSHHMTREHSEDSSGCPHERVASNLILQSCVA